jgi:hypothetical protein
MDRRRSDGDAYTPALSSRAFGVEAVVHGHDPDRAHAAAASRFDAGGRVLDDDAARGEHPELVRRAEKDVGSRLAVRHFLGRDERLETVADAEHLDEHFDVGRGRR